MADKNRLTGPLAELLLSQQEEIAKFKWIESEKTGRDIGWEQASEAWFQEHFADWIREQRQSLDQVLRDSAAPKWQRPRRLAASEMLSI